MAEDGTQVKLVVEAALRENEEILDFKLLGFSSQGRLNSFPGSS